MNFKSIELGDKPVFDRAFNRRYYDNSWFTFTNLLIWRENYSTAWALQDESLFVRLQANGLIYFLPAFTPPEKSFVLAVDAVVQQSQVYGDKFLMKGLSPEMCSEVETAWPGRFRMEPQREYFDYLYRAEDLRTLAGRKYHSKRNFVNRFRAEHSDWQYEPLTTDSGEDCLQVAAAWCENRNCDADAVLSGEYRAIEEALQHFDVLGLRGGIIRLAGRPVAFSFGEMLNADTMVIHMEKADPSVQGLYAMINQECCRNAWGDVQFINREEDMGEDGLRKAKESYYPVRLVEKYKIFLREG
ncbi:MAG: DUF2156 domain-containing protein [Negativicutes bacterium]